MRVFKRIALLMSIFMLIQTGLVPVHAETIALNFLEEVSDEAVGEEAKLKEESDEVDREENQEEVPVKAKLNEEKVENVPLTMSSPKEEVLVDTTSQGLLAEPFSMQSQSFEFERMELKVVSTIDASEIPGSVTVVTPNPKTSKVFVPENTDNCQLDIAFYDVDNNIVDYDHLTVSVSVYGEQVSNTVDIDTADLSFSTNDANLVNDDVATIHVEIGNHLEEIDIVSYKGNIGQTVVKTPNNAKYDGYIQVVTQYQSTNDRAIYGSYSDYEYCVDGLVTYVINEEYDGELDLYILFNPTMSNYNGELVSNSLFKYSGYLSFNENMIISTEDVSLQTPTIKANLVDVTGDVSGYYGSVNMVVNEDPASELYDMGLDIELYKSLNGGEFYWSEVGSTALCDYEFATMFIEYFKPETEEYLFTRQNGLSLKGSYEIDIDVSPIDLSELIDEVRMVLLDPVPHIGEDGSESFYVLDGTKEDGYLLGADERIILPNGVEAIYVFRAFDINGDEINYYELPEANVNLSFDQILQDIVSTANGILHIEDNSETPITEVAFTLNIGNYTTNFNVTLGDESIINPTSVIAGVMSEVEGYKSFEVFMDKDIEVYGLDLDEYQIAIVDENHSIVKRLNILDAEQNLSNSIILEVEDFMFDEYYGDYKYLFTYNNIEANNIIDELDELVQRLVFDEFINYVEPKLVRKSVKNDRLALEFDQMLDRPEGFGEEDSDYDLDPTLFTLLVNNVEKGIRSASLDNKGIYFILDEPVFHGDKVKISYFDGGIEAVNSLSTYLRTDYIDGLPVTVLKPVQSFGPITLDNETTVPYEDSMILQVMEAQGSGVEAGYEGDISVYILGEELNILGPVATIADDNDEFGHIAVPKYLLGDDSKYLFVMTEDDRNSQMIPLKDTAGVKYLDIDGITDLGKIYIEHAILKGDVLCPATSTEDAEDAKVGLQIQVGDDIFEIMLDTDANGSYKFGKFFEGMTDVTIVGLVEVPTTNEAYPFTIYYSGEITIDVNNYDDYDLNCDTDLVAEYLARIAAGEVGAEQPPTSSGGSVNVLAIDPGYQFMLSSYLASRGDTANQGGTSTPIANGTAVVNGPSVVPTIIVDEATAEFVAVSFKDINGWYMSYINHLSSLKIMNGKGNDLFDPKGHMTRAEVVQVLMNMTDGAKVTEVMNVKAFNDVEVTSWYNEAVVWAKANGLVEGYEGNFMPMDNITRQDFAVMINRYMGIMGKDLDMNVDPKEFEDRLSISKYALDSVGKLQESGLVTGSRTNEFMPKANATRGEAAKVISLLVEMLNQ